MAKPHNILERFPTELACLQFLEAIRWEGKPKCPYCRHPFTTPVVKERRHHCNNCNTTFSVTVDTIFHGTRLPLRKWFIAICLTDSIERVPVRRLAESIGINKNTACRVATRIYKASQEDRRVLLLIRSELYER